MRGLEEHEVHTGGIFRREAGVHQDRRRGGAHLDNVSQLGSGHAGHAIVGHDEIVGCWIEDDQRLFGALHGVQDVAQAAEKPLREGADLGIVINQKNHLKEAGRRGRRRRVPRPTDLRLVLPVRFHFGHVQVLSDR